MTATATPLSIVVGFPDGTRTPHSVPSGRAIVGSAAAADVPIERAAELEPRHVLIVGNDQGVWVSIVKNARVPAYADGKAFSFGRLPFGAELDIGSIVLHIDRINGGGSSGTRKRALLRQGALLALVLAAMFAAVVTFAQPQSADSVPGSEGMPDLFSGGDYTCGSGAPPRKTALASVSAAAVRESRYAFEPADGLEAVRLLRKAELCFEKAGDASASRASSARRAALESRIENDFKSHLLAIEIGRKTMDEKTMLPHVRALRRLVADRPSAFRDWLDRTERQITADQANKKGNQ